MVGTRELNYIFDFSKTTGENIDNVIIKTTLKEIDFGVLRKNTSDLLKKKDKPRPVIVKFASCNFGHEFFNSEKCLKDKTLSITESFTREKWKDCLF